jgi:hypothetical protein
MLKHKEPSEICRTQFFYHGTAAKTDFTAFSNDLIYLAPSRIEAQPFASNPILAKGKQGNPRVLKVQAKIGDVKNIDEAVIETIFNEGDIDETIENEVQIARGEGYRYLEFEHPGIKNNFVARIAMYPREDLTIKNCLPIICEIDGE